MDIEWGNKIGTLWSEFKRGTGQNPYIACFICNFCTCNSCTLFKRTPANRYKVLCWTPPNLMVVKVPVFDVLHETFWPKSAKSRGGQSLLYQIWFHATYWWCKTAKISDTGPIFNEPAPYLLSLEAQNLVICIRHSSPKASKFNSPGMRHS